jgi:beta-1,4-N-acetylglucosaminyltransferase
MRTCFVTVGTTKFDALVETVDSEPVLSALRAKGFDRVLVQYGGGDYVPFAARGANDDAGMVLESYRFKPSLQEDFAAASLVISHAGYGCLMESLALGKAVVAVINTRLMGNHQTEIAGELSRHGHAEMCEPDALAATLRDADFSQRAPLPPAQPQAYAAHIDRLLGFF